MVPRRPSRFACVLVPLLTIGLALGQAPFELETRLGEELDGGIDVFHEDAGSCIRLRVSKGVGDRALRQVQDRRGGA
jgi:hypothetical protein